VSHLSFPAACLGATGWREVTERPWVCAGTRHNKSSRCTPTFIHVRYLH